MSFVVFLHHYFYGETMKKSLISVAVASFMSELIANGNRQKVSLM
jgi:hypothetical protein